LVEQAPDLALGPRSQRDSNRVYPPIEKMARLLSATGVEIGLLCNGLTRLVFCPTGALETRNCVFYAYALRSPHLRTQIINTKKSWFRATAPDFGRYGKTAAT
ncbi:MAG: hypothetical protein ACPG4T_16985, partial [Nannocystaceae bacterium]